LLAYRRQAWDRNGRIAHAAIDVSEGPLLIAGAAGPNGGKHVSAAPTLRLAVKAVLMTGVRKSEFIDATWKELEQARAITPYYRGGLPMKRIAQP